jgi:hypothetical protein
LKPQQGIFYKQYLSLSQVFKYIKAFYAKEFNPYYFVLILFLTGAIIYLNYWHLLETRYVAGGKTKGADLLGYYLLYFIPFAIAFFLQPLFF